ncbi:MAG: glutaminyl-peptide cyclotransferase, partial [Flavobacterium sp.]
MLYIKSLTVITLSLLIGSCEGDKNEKNNLFSIDTSILKQVYQPNESADFVIKNEKAKKIDSVNYILNNKSIGTSVANNKLHYSFENEKLGWHLIKAKVYFENETAEIETNFTIVAQDAPKLLTYKIINTYPHDIKAYTQGFEFYRDTLIEGTGNGEGTGTGKRDISSLRKTNYRTGEVYKKIELGKQYFGEGITVL